MRKYRVRYLKNPHQAEFAADIVSKFLHLSTGFGGGKSYSLVMKAFQLSMLNRNLPGGLVVPSLPEFKKDLLPLFEEVLLENNIPYKYHRTEMWFLFPWSRGKLYVATAEKKIRGPNWAYCLINEVTLISHTRYKEAIGRVRIKKAPCPQIATSGTPEGTDHWLYEQFIETPMPRSRIIYGDTRDNLQNLGEDYVQTLEASYDPIMLDAYLRGLFVNMNGNRFYYSYDPKRNDDPSIERIPGYEVAVTLDYNVAPMVATLWHILYVRNSDGQVTYHPNGEAMRKAVAFDEIIIHDGADTKKMSDAMYAYGLDPEMTVIYPDPAGKNRRTSGPPDNEILKQNGWHRIKVRAAAPQFRKRQLAVCNLMARAHIQLNPVRCKALKKDCEAVAQDQATYEKIKTNPKLTHASDGMDYFIDIEFPLSGNKPLSRSTKYR